MASPTRRQLLHTALLLPAAGLAGCGFQLRGAPSFAFQSIYVGGASSSFTNELKRNLRAQGTVQVVEELAERDKADVILDILADLREKTVVGVNASGQVREFQLRSRVRYRLRTPKGREITPDTEMLLQRDISFNESAVLAKEAEETQIYRDMQSDLVQQMLRRLAAVKTIA
jgi:LPS-assembly lipoprotein